MKTLKIFAVLCLFVVLPNTKAVSQVSRGSYEWTVTITEGDCVDENVTGTVTVQQMWTRSSYHEKGRGTLIGSRSGDEYKIVFENNSEFLWHNNIVTWGYIFPMMLFHEGKLVAIIHEAYRLVVLSDNYFTGPYIHDRYVYSIECK
jgi:hypothetical protein